MFAPVHSLLAYAVPPSAMKIAIRPVTFWRMNAAILADIWHGLPEHSVQRSPNPGEWRAPITSQSCELHRALVTTGTIVDRGGRQINRRSAPGRGAIRTQAWRKRQRPP